MLLFFFGETINPKKPIVIPVQQEKIATIDINEILIQSKEHLSNAQKQLLIKLESKLKEEENTDKIHVLNHLASFWKDSAKVYEPYLYYLSEAAKLENSEKSLTFAAQQLINNLLEVGEPSIQNWLATNAKVLFDKALIINPNNDSSKIGLGACYILGNISTNPMEGILPVKAIADKNPNNLFAQIILGLGGKKSTQYNKAIERFLVIYNHQPKNLFVLLNLAECFELKGDKVSAKLWYLKSNDLISNTNIKKEIEKRIKELN